MRQYDAEAIILEAFGIQNFENMQATLHDHNTIDIEILWMIEIHYNSATAYLGFIKTEHWSKTTFIPSKVGNKPIETSQTSLLDIANTANLVTTALRDINIIDDENQISWGETWVEDGKGGWEEFLDSYSLEVKVYSRQIQTQFYYVNRNMSNLGAESMNNLWEAIKAFVIEIVDRSANRKLYNFVAIHWRLNPLA